MSEQTVYLGNPNLKRANVDQEWTKEEMEENKRKLDNFQSGVTTEKTPEKKKRSGVNQKMHWNK